MRPFTRGRPQRLAVVWPRQRIALVAAMPEARGIERLFVCVGAQKAGTTWLARILAQHPDFFLTPVKEIHYFDHVRGITAHLSDRKRRSRHRKYHRKLWTQLHRWQDLRAQRAWYRDYMRDPIDDTWYADLFRHRGPCRFAGEATPEYALLGEEGFRHIRRLAPDARILFILRNPVTRAWSQALHYCRANRLDVAAQSPEALMALLDTDRFRALGNYVGVLQDLEAVFSPAQTRLEFYEDIHADRAAALARICRFIGLDPALVESPDLSRRYNRSQNADMPAAVRRHLRQTFRDQVREIRTRTGEIPESWLREFDIA